VAGRVTSKPAIPVVSAEAARRLLLGGQGLLADPTRRATPTAVCRQIERMGFVQVDTINIVERAHHHILHSRFDGYRPPMLSKLIERDRRLFEHWTHDASVIPTIWLDHWKVRFERFRAGWRDDPWWEKRMGGEADKVIARVRKRVESEGPLMSRHFEPEGTGPSGPWWGWKPAKAALEHLWRAGDLVVSARVNFHKVYDLTERVFPNIAARPVPEETTHVDWACRTALDRLGVATPAELAGFFRIIPLAKARDWTRRAIAEGDAIDVTVEAENGEPPRRACAHPDWRRRVARAPTPPDRMRLLSPFDPVLRDRKRAERLFGFFYRFEAFVPAAKRQYGYYVMPILEGERLVGRLDLKFDRDAGVLRVLGLWWEPQVKNRRERRRTLEHAVDGFARAIGAERFAFERPRGRPAERVHSRS